MDLNEVCSDAWSQKSAEWRVLLKISRTNDERDVLIDSMVQLITVT